MVEYTSRIDLVFSVLSDPVRRDILERVNETELSVNQIALDYDMSLAAVSKHIKLMVEAGVVSKRRQGRYQLVSAHPAGMEEILQYVSKFVDIRED